MAKINSSITADRIRMFGVPYRTANGLDFTLMWTNRSISAAEDLGLFSPNCGPNKTFQLLVWACLLPCLPTVNPDDAADMIDIESAAGRVENLADAIKLCREKAEPPKVDPQQPETGRMETPTSETAPSA